MRLLISAGACDSYALERIYALTLEKAVEESRVRAGPSQFEQDRAEATVRHGWSWSKLREMRALFELAHMKSGDWAGLARAKEPGQRRWIAYGTETGDWRGLHFKKD